MPLPVINTYSVNEKTIGLIWAANPDSNIASWNLYAAPSVSVSFMAPDIGVQLPGGFTKVLSGICNRDFHLTPGSVYVSVDRSQLGIEKYDPCYFLLTSNDKNGIESALDSTNLHAVPFLDTYFEDEADFPVNLVYKNFEFDISAGYMFASDAYLDVDGLLGRPARQIKIKLISGDKVQVKFASLGSDSISITPTIPFDLIRNDLKVERIYFANPSAGDCTVQVYVAG